MSDRPSSPPSATARFDAAHAWQRAVALLIANREVVLVIAGVFFLLPQLVVELALPKIPAGSDDPAAAEAYAAILIGWWPLLLGSMAIQATGMLAVIALLSAPDRPTVGESLLRGVRALPSYIAVQLMIGASVGLAIIFAMIPFAAFAGEAGAAIGMVPALLLAFWIFVRTCLAGPVIVAESVRSPFDALIRSWRLTAGRAARLFVFLALIMLAAVVIFVVATAVPGSILLAVAGEGTAAPVISLLGGLVLAAFTLTLVAALTAAHGQLTRKR